MSFLEKLIIQIEKWDNVNHAPLGLLYRIDGSQELEEYILDHFEGYQNSRPVRIGNGAHNQLQLDIFGALLDAIYLIIMHDISITIYWLK
ncbi:MAG: hypothetical protein KatS3mg129_2354 [Leptospiraceae bacterium]|nr:MAG: hypothetical protein KatS3mg129_2354 [Leptospiraceae bacterium]